MRCPKTELIPRHQYRTVTSKQPLNWAPLGKIINWASALDPVNHFYSLLLLFQSLLSDSNLSCASRLHLFNDLIQPRFFFLQDFLWTFRPRLTLHCGCGHSGGLAVDRAPAMYFTTAVQDLAWQTVIQAVLLFLHVHWPTILALNARVSASGTKDLLKNPRLCTHLPTREASKSYFLQIHWIEFLRDRHGRAGFSKRCRKLVSCTFRLALKSPVRL